MNQTTRSIIHLQTHIALHMASQVNWIISRLPWVWGYHLRTSLLNTSYLWTNCMRKRTQQSILVTWWDFYDLHNYVAIAKRRWFHRKVLWLPVNSHTNIIRLLQTCHKQICCKIITDLYLKLLYAFYLSVVCQLQSCHKCVTYHQLVLTAAIHSMGDFCTCLW